MRLPRLLRGGSSVLGSAVVLLVAVGMMLAPQLFTGRDPNAIVFIERLQPPSLAHPFGTDENGRDLWARVVYGARPTLTAAVALILISLVVGSLVGLVIGYAGRRADEVLMRVTEFFLAFPQIVWALAIAPVIGRGLVVCVLALSLTWWAQYARLMRAQVLVYKEREFILASRALGQRAWWILLRHLLPNCFSPVLVKATIDVSLAILLLAALSFLGRGGAAADARVGRDGDDRPQVPARLSLVRDLPRPCDLRGGAGLQHPGRARARRARPAEPLGERS